MLWMEKTKRLATEREALVRPCALQFIKGALSALTWGSLLTGVSGLQGWPLPTAH